MERPREVGPSLAQSSRGKAPARVFTLNPQEVPDPEVDIPSIFPTDESI